MRYEVKGNQVIAYPEGRISSDNSSEIQKSLEDIKAANGGLELVIDAEDLLYISSAGLRVLLKLTKDQKTPLKVRNVSKDVYDILDMTGFVNLLDVRRKMREISIDGCEIVGRGAIGTVYRIDEDTIVKVYNIPDCIPMIENEQKRSKQAFLKGIPTAISYDIVKVGDRYGSVFEMLKASTFNEMIRKEPERMDGIIRQYAGLIRQVHSVEMEPGELPSARDVFRKYLSDLGSAIPEDIRIWLVRLLDAMPENLHVVHGDIQLKNVMVSDGEPLLIDMDTLSVGDPVFDLMCLFVTYRLYPEDEPLNIQEFQGISQETADFICDKGLQYYFEGRDEEFIRKEKDRIMVLACVRFLHLVAVMDIGKPELRQTRINRALEHLKELQGKVDTLETRF